jgi:hypothetical protein
MDQSRQTAVFAIGVPDGALPFVSPAEDPDLDTPWREILF